MLAYFLWIGVIQATDVVRVLVILYSTEAGANAFAFRTFLGFVSVVLISVGIVMVNIENEYTALIILGVNKLLLVWIGYAFVLFPPKVDEQEELSYYTKLQKEAARKASQFTRWGRRKEVIN